MKAYLDKISGIEDAIIAQEVNDGTLTREREITIRNAFDEETNHNPAAGPVGALTRDADDVKDWVAELAEDIEENSAPAQFIMVCFSVFDAPVRDENGSDCGLYMMQLASFAFLYRTRARNRSMPDYMKDAIAETGRQLAEATDGAFGEELMGSLSAAYEKAARSQQ